MSISLPKFTNRKVSPGIADSGSGQGTFRRKSSSVNVPEFPREFPQYTPSKPRISESPTQPQSPIPKSPTPKSPSTENAPFLAPQSLGSFKKMLDNLPAWPNTKDAYELKEVVGIGATAVVYEAICIPRNERCAIKRINLDKLNTSMEEILKEIHAMCFCNHENVVTYHTSFVVREELWLILRLLEGGSLLEIIKRKRKTTDCSRGFLDEITIATLLKEVLKGLEYFHAHGQIHRDIKAGNILLGNDGTVQIADFGVSSWLSTGGDLSRQRVRHTFVGTPCWMAPEVMEQHNGYDFKADIWSLGITAIEMITGRAPYHKYPPMKILMLTLQNDAPTIETEMDEKDNKDRYKHYGKSIRKFIADCLQKDPAKRPTATELLKHSFIKNNARDKKYLYTTLVRPFTEIPLKMQSTNSGKEAVRRRKVSHLNSVGEWVWSSEDDTDDEFDDFERSSLSTETVSNISTPTPSTPDLDFDGNTIQAMCLSPVLEAEPEPTSQSVRAQVINIVLRVRNVKRELNDIRFEYHPGTDTEEGIASELVAAGLIKQADVQSIASNLAQLIRNMDTVKSINFYLGSVVQYESNGSLKPTEVDTTVVGYANMSIAD